MNSVIAEAGKMVPDPYVVRATAARAERALARTSIELQVKFTGEDGGAPYSIDADFYDENDDGSAKKLAKKFRLKSRVVNGCPNIYGKLPDVKTVAKFATMYGADSVNLEPESPRGTTVHFE